MEVSSLSASASQVVRTAEQNPAMAAKLLKKAVEADRDIVNTLLPPTGQLDIRA